MKAIFTLVLLCSTILFAETDKKTVLQECLAEELNSNATTLQTNTFAKTGTQMNSAPMDNMDKLRECQNNNTDVPTINPKPSSY